MDSGGGEDLSDVIRSLCGFCCCNRRARSWDESRSCGCESPDEAERFDVGWDFEREKIDESRPFWSIFSSRCTRVQEYLQDLEGQGSRASSKVLSVCEAQLFSALTECTVSGQTIMRDEYELVNLVRSLAYV